MRKKILIFTNSLQPGGAERQLVYLAQALLPKHEVHFLIYDKKGVFVDFLDQLGIVIHTFLRKGFWKSSRDLRTFIHRERFDVVVSYLPECNMISILAGLPSKSWHIITGARSANPKYVTDPKLRWYYRIHLLSDAVISNSVTNKNDILKVNKWMKADKVNVVYNILSPTDCHSQYTPFKDGRIHIVVAANYRSVKNLEGVLRALLAMKLQHLEQIHIDWYGLEIDSTLKDGRKFISDNHLEGVIVLHPLTNHVLDVYNEADVVGLFSHFEGLPNSLCEALALGKMVICTPVSDMPLLLKDTYNIVCQSDSPIDIKTGLESLIEIPKEIIVNTGKCNKEQFSSIFNKTNLEGQLLKVILG